jgi:hypothetical protein
MANRVRGSAPLKVLFVGNSFTARNDLPGLIAKLAAILPAVRVQQGQRAQPDVVGRQGEAPRVRRRVQQQPQLPVQLRPAVPVLVAVLALKKCRMRSRSPGGLRRWYVAGRLPCPELGRGCARV